MILHCSSRELIEIAAALVIAGGVGGWLATKKELFPVGAQPPGALPKAKSESSPSTRPPAAGNSLPSASGLPPADPPPPTLPGVPGPVIPSGPAIPGGPGKGPGSVAPPASEPKPPIAPPPGMVIP